jgi:DNA repair protein RecN (Recombination protein N)
VGERLSDLASKHQVLCLTHLPQIAARGDRHLRVSKMSLGGRTVARLVAGEGAARVEEIARMSGGARISEPTRAHARDLLRRARPGGLWDGKICSDNK